MHTTPTPGQIIILNGAPRAGKSTIAAAIQDTFEGLWLNLGVDRWMQMTPARYQPALGLRPGGERPTSNRSSRSSTAPSTRPSPPTAAWASTSSSTSATTTTTPRPSASSRPVRACSKACPPCSWASAVPSR